MLPVQRSLLSMINNSSYEEVDHYLMELSNQSEAILGAEVTQRDERNMTPLHHTVERADLQMTRVLLSFNAPIDASIRDQNIEDFARELADPFKYEDQEKTIKHQHVYALIKSMGNWQRSPRSNALFMRSMRTIEASAQMIEGAVDKVGILFTGMTGEGKSTLINYLILNVDYRLESSRIRGIKRITPLVEEIVRVGHSPQSETLYPQVVSMADQHVAIELPGFEDTRGAAEEICAGASMCMLADQLRSIQAIFLVCSWGSLNSKMLNYRKAAMNIGAMIALDPTTRENLILVVTKPDPDLIEDFVRERLAELAASEQWSSLPNIVDQKEQNRDTWEKHCIRIVTETILSRSENILIADVTSPQTRLEFNRILSNLSTKTKRINLFNFKNYSKHTLLFLEILKNHATLALQIRHRHVNALKALEQLNRSNLDKKAEITKARCERDVYHEIIVKEFDSKPYQDKIQQIQRDLKQIQSTLLKCRQKKQLHEENHRRISRLIVSLEADVSIKKISIISENNLKHGQLTDLLTQIDLRKLTTISRSSKYMHRATLTRAGSVHILSEGIFTSSTEVIENINNRMMKLIVDDFYQQRSEPWERQGSFGRIESVEGLEVYYLQPINETPQHLSRIRDLRRELGNLGLIVENCHKEAWRLTESITQLKYQEAQEQVKDDSARAQHEKEISFSKLRMVEISKKIEESENELTSLLAVHEQVSKDAFWSRLEFQVNIDLFKKISELIRRISDYPLDQDIVEFCAAVSSTSDNSV